MTEELLREISATSSRIRGVANWFRGDANAKFLDPNADELVEMMVRVNNIRNKGGELPADVTQSLADIWQNRRTNYSRNGIGTNCTSYEMLDSLYEGELSKEVIGPHCLVVLRRIADGSLYTSKVRRDGNPNYVWDDASKLAEISSEFKMSTPRERELSGKYIDLLSKRVTSVPSLDNSALDDEGEPSMSLIDFIEQGIEDTNLIFKPSEEQQGAFRKAWTGIVLTDVIRGTIYGDAGTVNRPRPLYLYQSGGNMPTGNMQSALIESRISPSGMLPEGRCYCGVTIPMTPELQQEARELYNKFITGEELSTKVPEK